MSTLAGEKRKHDDQRVVPWWLLLLVGFGLGIVFTLGSSLGRGGAVTVYSADSIPDNYAAQATMFVAEAALHAARAENQLAAGELDPMLATATAIVSQATLQALQPPSSP